jgi:hypothetical protein
MAPAAAWEPPPPVECDVQVPTDGIHLEVAAGACILHGVPSEDTVLDIAVKDASLHLQTH